MNRPPVALTIAGSDSGGGAGIQADLKTMAAHGVFGTSVVTALTAQNTVGVHAVRVTPAHFTAAQLDAVLADLAPRAVKTGMLATVENIAVIAERAARLPNLVVDPVLVSSSGRRLADAAAERAYLDLLLPHAAVVTPNLDEAAVLTGGVVSTVEEMVTAARRLAETGVRCVVVTGGHLDGDRAVDVLWRDGAATTLATDRVATANNHGTGCTFSAALVSALALGWSVEDSVRAAKVYVTRALALGVAWRLGAGRGPLGWQAHDVGATEEREYAT